MGPNSDMDTGMRMPLNTEDTQGRHRVMTEAEIVVMCLQAKECQGLLETTRSWREAGRDLPREPSETAQPCRHLGQDF